MNELFSDLSSVFRKEWDAYPVYNLTSEFPSFVIDDNFYYLNALERAFTAMETEIIAARNVVNLLLSKIK